MFPLPISTYIYAGLILIGIIGVGYGQYEHSKYVAYKNKVELLAKEQEAKIESIKKQQDLVTKGIEDEYNAKLALIRRYYADGMRQPSSSSLPAYGITPKPVDVTTAYNILAGQCSQTTLMLVELQKWLNKQIGIE